jgi:hypothetical protein
VTLPSGGQIAFQSAVDLLPRIAAADDVATCLARHVARFGVGMSDGPDEGVGKEILRLLGPSRTLADLFVSAVKTRAFRYRKPAEGEVL